MGIFPRRFQSWRNQNLELVKDQMQILKANVTDVTKAKRLVLATPEPTKSAMPSSQPMRKPTRAPQPPVVASGAPVVASGANVRTIPPKTQCYYLLVVVLVAVLLQEKTVTKTQWRSRPSRVSREKFGTVVREVVFRLEYYGTVQCLKESLTAT